MLLNFILYPPLDPESGCRRQCLGVGAKTVETLGVVMTLGLFNSFLDHQIFAPVAPLQLGRKEQEGTYDFEGGLHRVFLGTLFFYRAKKFFFGTLGTLFFFQL